MTKAEITEVKRYLHRTQKAFNATMNAETGSDLRDAWEDFVDHYGKTMNRMISAALDRNKSSEWAHRLKRARSHDDPGLIYMYEARNIVQHGLRPVGEFRNPSALIGGAVSISDSRNIQLENVSINGQTIKSALISHENGKLTKFEGDGRQLVRELPAQVLLGPIYNSDKGKTFPFPATLRGQRIKPGAPRSLAVVAVTALAEIVSEFEDEMKS